MNKEDQALFDAYVRYRRSLYPPWYAMAILAPAFVVGITAVVFLFAAAWSK